MAMHIVRWMKLSFQTAETFFTLNLIDLTFVFSDEKAHRNGGYVKVEFISRYAHKGWEKIQTN